MSKHQSRLSSILGLTVVLSVASSSYAQEDYTPTSSPPIAADPQSAVAPGATDTTTTAASTTPTMEIERSTSTMDRVDQDRWEFPNRPLIITGSTLLVASYVPAVIAAAMSDNISNKAYYPVAGPWLELSQEPSSKTGTALLAIDGVLQGVGALAFLAGFVIPERKTQDWYLIGENQIMLSPRMSARSVGLGAAGRF